MPDEIVPAGAGPQATGKAPQDWGFPPVQPAAPVQEPPSDLVAAAAPKAAPDEPSPDWRSPAAVAEAPSAGVMPVPRRHPATTPPVSPVRALAGAVVAVAGVLLGIGALLWATDAPKGAPALQASQAQTAQVAPSSVRSPSAAASPTDLAASPSPLQTKAALAPVAAPKPALTVLNNSNRAGLAKRAAAGYAAAGWPIRITGSFRGRVSVTTVYYAPGQQASAVALQKAFPAIGRVRPRFVGLPGSGLTVVLTRAYQV